MQARINRVSSVLPAYSFRYNAQAIPKGMANKVETSVTDNVPIMAGKIPPVVIPSVGKLNKKSALIDGKPSEKKWYRINIKNRHTISVLPPSKPQ